jgi:hypothetical protein
VLCERKPLRIISDEANMPIETTRPYVAMANEEQAAIAPSAPLRRGTPQEQEMVKREIESTDRQIDRLVYELYGLTEEEIKIVEGG